MNSTGVSFTAGLLTALTSLTGAGVAQASLAPTPRPLPVSAGHDFNDTVLERWRLGEVVRVPPLRNPPNIDGSGLTYLTDSLAQSAAHLGEEIANLYLAHKSNRSPIPPEVLGRLLQGQPSLIIDGAAERYFHLTVRDTPRAAEVRTPEDRLKFMREDLLRLSADVEQTRMMLTGARVEFLSYEQFFGAAGYHLYATIHDFGGRFTSEEAQVRAVIECLAHLNPARPPAYGPGDQLTWVRQQYLGVAEADLAVRLLRAIANPGLPRSPQETPILNGLDQANLSPVEQAAAVLYGRTPFIHYVMARIITDRALAAPAQGTTPIEALLAPILTGGRDRQLIAQALAHTVSRPELHIDCIPEPALPDLLQDIDAMGNAARLRAQTVLRIGHTAAVLAGTRPLVPGTPDAESIRGNLDLITANLAEIPTLADPAKIAPLQAEVETARANIIGQLRRFARDDLHIPGMAELRSAWDLEHTLARREALADRPIELRKFLEEMNDPRAQRVDDLLTRLTAAFSPADLRRLRLLLSGRADVWAIEERLTAQPRDILRYEAAPLDILREAAALSAERGRDPVVAIQRAFPAGPPGSRDAELRRRALMVALSGEALELQESLTAVPRNAGAIRRAAEAIFAGRDRESAQAIEGVWNLRCRGQGPQLHEVLRQLAGSESAAVIAGVSPTRLEALRSELSRPEPAVHVLSTLLQTSDYAQGEALRRAFDGGQPGALDRALTRLPAPQASELRLLLAGCPADTVRTLRTLTTARDESGTMNLLLTLRPPQVGVVAQECRRLGSPLEDEIRGAFQGSAQARILLFLEQGLDARAVAAAIVREPERAHEFMEAVSLRGRLLTAEVFPLESGGSDLVAFLTTAKVRPDYIALVQHLLREARRAAQP